MQPNRPQHTNIIAGMILGALFLAMVQILVLIVFKIAGIL